MRPGRALLAGIDGCKGGWVCALRLAGSRHVAILLLECIDDIGRLTPRPAMTAVDMPIGLLDVARKGGRECERAARALLKGKTSSVFTVPCRATLPAKTYPEALRLSLASSPDRIGLSKQAFHLLAKLRELDRYITPARQKRIVEAHPELAFARLNGGIPALTPKREPEGRAARQKLLRRAGIALDGVYGFLPRHVAAPDDILDAIALTLTAERVLTGEATRLGKGRDAHGLKMEICF